MISIRGAASAITILLAASTCVQAASEEWPRWRGPANTGHIPANYKVPEKLPAEAKTLWRVPLGDGYGSPVMAGGLVFVLDKIDEKEVLRAIDAGAGKEVWRKVIDDAADDTQGKGPRSTPVVDGDRIYVISCRGEFQCLNVKDGSQIWRKNFVNDFEALFIGEKPNPIAIGATRHGNDGPPLIDGDNIYVQAGGTNGASVVCLKKKTGALVWKAENDQSGYAAAVLATVQGTKQLVCFTAEGVIGLSPDKGKLLWRHPIKTTWARHVTTPVFTDDMVMVSSHEHGLFGIKISKDGQSWKAEQAWLNKKAAISFSSPVMVDGHLYGLGPAKNIICVEPKTGEILWSKDGLITTAPSKAHASFLVAGKTLWILADSGQLIQIAVDAKECREISRTQVSGTTWSNPAYAGGKLYLRDMKTLLAVSLMD